MIYLTKKICFKVCEDEIQRINFNSINSISSRINFLNYLNNKKIKYTEDTQRFIVQN